MIYKKNMLCKHFKGETLLEKNIYQILELGVLGKDIDESIITYTGDGILKDATNLVVYANIFQNNKLFAREYDDISSELSDDKKSLYHQLYKVEPLTEDEIKIVNSKEFVEEKIKKTNDKFKDSKVFPNPPVGLASKITDMDITYSNPEIFKKR